LIGSQYERVVQLGGFIRHHFQVKNGGVGAGVSPKTALSVGLKVDADALPDALKQQIKAGKVNLDDPATTIALLELNAIVGVTAFANPDGSVKSMGIQCAFCHSTVDNSFAPGIGKRLDGWANRDLNVGAIVSLAPNLKPFTDLLGVDVETVKKVLASWGPRRYDAELDKDGKAFRPDGKQAGTLIPPAFGLAGVNLSTWTGFEHGVHFHLEETVTAIDGKRVKLKGGDTLDADLVVVGIGVRPRLELAERAGLKTERGLSWISTSWRANRTSTQPATSHVGPIRIVVRTSASNTGLLLNVKGKLRRSICSASARRSLPCRFSGVNIMTSRSTMSATPRGGTKS